MELESLGARLRANHLALEQLLAGIDTEAAHARPAEGKWSVVEIVCHLADEEREDFRRRVDLTLQHPGQAWPSIDPPGWVTARRYQDRSLDDALADFAREREASLAWLTALAAPDWNRTYQHPALGPLRAGDVMASWLAHDLLHLRQLTRLLFGHQQNLTAPFDTRYAGEW